MERRRPIGISSTVGSVVGPYINVEYTTLEGDGEFTGNKLFFYKPMTLTAYYPFTGEEGTAPGTDGVIESDTRPENQKPDKQLNIDYMWDSQSGIIAADPNVNFKFAHKMSKITFTFQSSPAIYDEFTGIKLADKVEVSDMVSYGIEGLVLDGTFNTATGVCAVKNDVTAETLDINVKNTVEHNVAVKPIILFPQTFSDGSVKLHITSDELNDENSLQHYNCPLSFSNGEIKPGYHYRYTIKVTKIGLIVGEMTVEPWVEENRSLVATIDGNKAFENQ